VVKGDEVNTQRLCRLGKGIASLFKDLYNPPPVDL